MSALPLPGGVGELKILYFIVILVIFFGQYVNFDFRVKPYHCNTCIEQDGREALPGKLNFVLREGCKILEWFPLKTSLINVHIFDMLKVSLSRSLLKYTQPRLPGSIHTHIGSE